MADRASRYLERRDQFRKMTDMKAISEEFKPEELLIFKVFDRVKVLVDTTTDFPLDLKCTVLFTYSDHKI